MTIAEKLTYEAICSLATTLEKEVPKIRKALESIAKDLSHGSTPPLCEAEPDDLPF